MAEKPTKNARGDGAELKSSGIGFSHQLVSMYAQTIGDWSSSLTALVAFFCIFGSTITVLDGYAGAERAVWSSFLFFVVNAT
jgi:hypothetical protein